VPVRAGHPVAAGGTDHVVTRRNVLSAGAGLLACTASASDGPPVSGQTVRAVVAAGGGGDFQTIQRAVDHVLDHPPESVARVILEIRPGIYRERVKIPQDRPRLTLLGSDAATTLITSRMSAADAGGTFFSPTVEVNGAAFEAESISFENTFGTGSQAVAISVHSDRASFRNCRFLGWQDTLYAAFGRQYYRDCRIEGHVDFIFGNAAAVFDHCEIYSRGSGYITAHSRTRPDEPTGFVFRDCSLTGPPDARVFLGRPWRSCARVVYLNCRMDRHIRPEGWNNWDRSSNEKSAWFAELASTGPGADTTNRAGWAQAITTAEAAAFAPEVFLKGSDGWNPIGVR
jgi:pectinesterase